ncbi:MAG: hypothetical protein WCU00_02975 [Candidatus Latescibacterota bacterium]
MVSVIFLAAFSLLFLPLTIYAEIICEGAYGGHLQGVAFEPNKAVYWSFTVALVKTDLDGRMLKRIDVPSHHGDLTYQHGKLYVAVNLGAFNREPGYADSWVYVYDAADLTFLSRYKVPEVVHGAGGMTFCDGHFYIVGGLPKGYKENYVYEYDAGFTFVRCHVIASGFTLMGIQTVEYHNGFFWFGCYGKPDNNPLMVTDKTFQIVATSETDFSVGIAGMTGLTFLRGVTKQDEATKMWTGSVERMKTDNAPAKGAILVFTKEM